MKIIGTIILLLLTISHRTPAPAEVRRLAANNQQHEPYPQGYFRNPLGIPMQLAANFGELRSNHFHMGFDIRTNQRENLPVYASASGYVSKIKIERFGFGRAIYITHPNGFTTLYAHLNTFYPALNDFVKDKQYRDEQWEQEINFEPNQFPVLQGQFIAYSGNTGGSAGPHLHFEIRETKTGNNLNPWLFGFNLSDKTPPFIYRLYYYDRRQSIYETSPKPIALKGSNGNYATANVVTVSSPSISFGITAEDIASSSSFHYGIYEATLSVDDTLRSSFRLNDISYDDTRYINGSVDYKTKLSGGAWIQHLSRLPGNQSSIFSGNDEGVLLLTDTAIHNAEIVVKDAVGNTSKLGFHFRYNPKMQREVVHSLNAISLSPNKENVVSDTDFVLAFSPLAFYDTVQFIHRSQSAGDSKIVSAIHSMSDYTIPVHDSFTVRLKPLLSIADSLKSKVVMQLKTYNKKEAVKGKWVNGWYEARLRDFGNMYLLTDNISPIIKPVGWTNGSSVRNKPTIAFNVTDDAGEIKSFRALVDGKWLMFSRKKDLFIHTFDGRLQPGRHELVVTVEDVAGNVAERSFSFIK